MHLTPSTSPHKYFLVPLLHLFSLHTLTMRYCFHSCQFIIMWLKQVGHDILKPSNSPKHNLCALLAHHNYFLYTYHSVWRFGFLEYLHVVTDYKGYLILLLQLYLWVKKALNEMEKHGNNCNTQHFWDQRFARYRSFQISECYI